MLVALVVFAFSFTGCDWFTSNPEQPVQEEVSTDTLNEFPVVEFTLCDSVMEKGYTYDFGDTVFQKSVSMQLDSVVVLFSTKNVEYFEIYCDSTVLPLFTRTEDSIFAYELPIDMIPCDSTGVRSFKILADEIVAPVSIRN